MRVAAAPPDKAAAISLISSTTNFCQLKCIV